MTYMHTLNGLLLICYREPKGGRIASHGLIRSEHPSQPRYALQLVVCTSLPLCITCNCLSILYRLKRGVEVLAITSRYLGRYAHVGTRNSSSGHQIVTLL